MSLLNKISPRQPVINIVFGKKGVGKTTFANNVVPDGVPDGSFEPFNDPSEMPSDYAEGRTEPEPETVIKSVFCSYRGVLVVHDVQGNRIGHLCGEITLDKYREIERRSDTEITEFDGLEQYRCIVCELEKKEAAAKEEELFIEPDNDIVIEDDEEDFSPFSAPIKGNPYSNPNSNPNSSSNYANTRAKINNNVPTTQPANPAVGEFYIDITTGNPIPKVWNGKSWIDISASAKNGKI